MTLATAKCPICGQPTVQSAKPFCSRRCADIDLHRWFSGVYAIPVTDDANEDGEAAVSPKDRDEHR